MQTNHLPWWQQTVIYQIYPRSFYDSNGDGIGDLQGIIQKLDYLKDLGVETIWFSPFYASPQADFGYDISDYRSIAPEYGTMADAEQLIQEIHSRGMKIVLDMVMNHTSDQHEWFQQSKSSRNNPKSDWYIWKDGQGKNPPNNWKSIVWGRGWHYSETRNQWYYASFMPFQPDLNYRNPEVQKEMFDTVRFWLNKGVDGFRLDIFNCIIKDKDFRNNPWSPNPIPSVDWPGGNFQKRKYSVNQEENFEFAQKLRAVLDEYGENERFLVGEVFGSRDIVKRYLGKSDGLHLIFLFETLYFKFKAKWFKNTLKEFEKELAYPLIPTWVMGNHDIYRYTRRIKNDLTKARILALLQLSVRAVPTIYYGEEVGMMNAEIPREKAQDPMEKVFSWLPNWLLKLMPVSINRDVCRTPMQWNSNRYAGFSTNSPWLPITDDAQNRNVQSMDSDQNSLLNWYKELLEIRKKYAALHQGQMNILDTNDQDILHYQRYFGNEKIDIVINFSNTYKTVKMSGSLISASQKDIEIKNGQIELRPYSGAIVIK